MESKKEAWANAFCIYSQLREIPGHEQRLRGNEKVRAEILGALKQGISELELLGEQETANQGRKLYNEFSGTETYCLVEPYSQSNLREVIHAFARHGEAYNDSLTTVGVLQVIDLTNKLQQVYTGHKPRIFTSPANRTYETGKIIADEFGVPVEKRRELADFGGNYSATRDFIECTKEDAIFVLHKPQIESLTGKTLKHAEFETIRRNVQ